MTELRVTIFIITISIVTIQCGTDNEKTKNNNSTIIIHNSSKDSGFNTKDPNMITIDDLREASSEEIFESLMNSKETERIIDEVYWKVEAPPDKKFQLENLLIQQVNTILQTEKKDMAILGRCVGVLAFLRSKRSIPVMVAIFHFAEPHYRDTDVRYRGLVGSSLGMIGSVHNSPNIEFMRNQILHHDPAIAIQASSLCAEWKEKQCLPEMRQFREKYLLTNPPIARRVDDYIQQILGGG